MAGQKDNGKSTLFNLCQNMLGDGCVGTLKSHYLFTTPKGATQKSSHQENEARAFDGVDLTFVPEFEPANEKEVLNIRFSFLFFFL